MSGIEEFIEKLEVEFDDAPKGSLKPSSEFTDIVNWSSMHGLVVIALVDTEYDVTITGNDLRGISTIQELYDIVLERK